MARDPEKARERKRRYLEDPVDVVAGALRRENGCGTCPCEICDREADTILTALHEAGWRIVRTEDGDCYDPPEGFEFDHHVHPGGVAVTGVSPPPERWCAKHRDGWCAVDPDVEPEEGTDSVHTLCGWVITFPGGFDHRAPDCPECTAILAVPPRNPMDGFGPAYPGADRG